MAIRTKNISPENALSRLAALCARGEQAEGDLRRKLRTWGIGEPDASRIIDKLKAERYLDNERFARAYCRDKFRFNGWGRVKIEYMLRGKGVEPAAIAAALEEIDPDAYALQLRHAVQVKAASLAARDKAAVRDSLLRFALSRGYESHLALAVVDDVIKKDCGDEV